MSIRTPDWVKDAVFYQIFPDRFAKSSKFGKNGYLPKPTNLHPWGSPPTFHGFQGGDLLGIIENLSYLEELGINAIYLNPIFASASNHRYHTHDYLHVDPILGGNKALAKLLNEAHKRNIRIILDGVFNHASRGFFQFNHLMECGPESPYTDWFNVHSWPVNAFNDGQPPNFDAWWGIASLPKFNTKTPAVREFLWQVAAHWLKKGIDGWRLDVPNEIDDDEFWREFRRRCKAINPEAYIVGELWGEAQRWLQGDQFDGQMNYLFNRAALGYFSGVNMDQTDTVRTGYGYIQPLNGSQFAAELDRIFNQLYDSEIVLSQMNMLGSHDTPRTLTVARHDKKALRLMYFCQMTVPGAPNIYYGDEIGMSGAHDPYCRGAFPWQDEGSWDHTLRDDIKQYIQLRKETPALRRGNFRIVYANNNVVMYQREYRGQLAILAFNVGDREETIIAPPGFPQALEEKLNPEGQIFKANTTMSLVPQSGRVWVSPTTSR